MIVIRVFYLLFTLLHLQQTDATCNVTTGIGSFIPAERRLLACLQSNYDPSVRPAINPTDTIEVTVDSYMATIIDLDEKTSVLTTELWMYQTWTDIQLTWNLTDFPGVNEIFIPIEKIWNPEIVLYNNADESYRYMMDKLARVDYNGTVTWIPHGRLKSRCPVELSRFPFDTQTCQLWIGPGSYDQSLVHVHLAAEPVNYRPFMQNAAEWEVDGYSGRKQILQYNDKKYSIVIFDVTMKRTSTFFKYMLIWPSVVMAILTLSLFWVPVDSGERFMLASGLLICITLLLVLLEGYLPTDIGRLPLVAQYIGYNLAFIMLTILTSIVVFNFYHRDAKRSPVPVWMKRVLLGAVSRILCISSVQYAPLLPGDATRSHSVSGTDREMNDEPSPYKDDDNNDDDNKTMERTLKDIRNYLRYLATTNNNVTVQPSHRQLVVGEWHQVALVIDRLSFWIFFFITIVCTIAMYFHQ